MASSSPPQSKKPKLDCKENKEEEPRPEPTEHIGIDTRITPKYKRRKIALFFGYCGYGYQGMQKNPGAKTIEAELEEALFLSSAVPASERGNPHRCDWSRSARTDKGVSAVGQVVSGRFYVDPPGFVERLNGNLDPKIKVFGFKKTTGSFNAKKFCDRRRYVYLLPVFALDPKAHLGEGIVCESCLGNGYDCVPRRCGSTGNVIEIGEETETKDCNGRESKLEKVEPFCDGGIDHVKPEESGVELTPEKNVNGQIYKAVEASCIDEPERKFRYTEQVQNRLNDILKSYVGTHNFHNFTSRTKAVDPSAMRYILSFYANSVIDIDGIEFVKCEVVGQSFMLHQIRKMIGLAVAIMRNLTPQSSMDFALSKDEKISVPMAPETGLYLDECLFTSYNKKWKDSHEEISMDSFSCQADDFKMKYIYSHIGSIEHKEGAVALWLHTLNYHCYKNSSVEHKFSSLEKNKDSSSVEHNDSSVELKERNDNTMIVSAENTLKNITAKLL